MRVDVQVALGLHGQVDEAVPGEQRQHVIEEADAGLDLALAGAVEVEAERDVRSRRFAVGSARCGAWSLASDTGKGGTP